VFSIIFSLKVLRIRLIGAVLSLNIGRMRGLWRGRVVEFLIFKRHRKPILFATISVMEGKSHIVIVVHHISTNYFKLTYVTDNLDYASVAVWDCASLIAVILQDH